MALIDCWECKAHVSDQAAACPKCGAPVRKIPTTMPAAAIPPLPSASAQPAAAPNAALPSAKACPYCHTRLAPEAVVCPGCRAWYGYREGLEAYGAKGRFLLGCIFFGIGVALGMLIPAKKGGMIFAMLGALIGIAYWIGGLISWALRGPKKWYRKE